MNDAELMTQAPTVEGLRVEGLPKEDPRVWIVHIQGEYAGVINNSGLLYMPFKALTTDDYDRFPTYSEALGWIIKQHQEANS